MCMQPRIATTSRSKLSSKSAAVKSSTQLITSDMYILKRFLKCCSGNVAQPQSLCDHILCEAHGFALFPCQPLSRLFQLNHILMLFPDFNEDMGILPSILDSEDHGISNSVMACKWEACQKISSLSIQHLFHVLWTVFTDGLYELVVDVILDWP
jgi:hypothetical protein